MNSYNANPESMKASVSTFIELYENPVVVLGDRVNSGENEVELHREVGRFLTRVIQKNVKFLTVGHLALEIGKELENSGFSVKSFENIEAAARYILDNLNAGCTIFLKASRAMKFEKIIEYLRENK